MSVFEQTGQEKQRAIYRKWWVGKYCRTHSHLEFKKVVDVETFGCRSYVVGGARLVFEDGDKSQINIGYLAYRPRKMDVEVRL